MVDELSGTVKVRVKGSSRFVALDDVRDIPMGSEIDARKGVVELVSVASDGGAPQTAKFSEGVFKVTQSGAVTVLTLTEKLSCGTAGKASSRRQEGQEAPPVGRRQGQVPDQGQAQRGDRGRHEVARRGPLRQHAHARRARQGQGARLRKKQDRDRQGGRPLHRPPQALDR